MIPITQQRAQELWEQQFLVAATTTISPENPPIVCNMASPMDSLWHPDNFVIIEESDNREVSYMLKLGFKYYLPPLVIHI